MGPHGTKIMCLSMVQMVPQPHILWHFCDSLFCQFTDYRLPMRLLGLGRQIGHINFGAFRVFSAKLSPPILVHTVSPLSMFSINIWSAEKYTMRSSVLPLCLVYFSVEQTLHTNYSRNNIGQKCEGNCGLWVLNKMSKKYILKNWKKRGCHLGVTC